MQRRGAVQPVALAGHSLGELSALVAAGALEPSAGLRLAVRRGELMAARRGAARAGHARRPRRLRGAGRTARRRSTRWCSPTTTRPGRSVLAGPTERLRAASKTARAQRRARDRARRRRRVSLPCDGRRRRAVSRRARPGRLPRARGARDLAAPPRRPFARRARRAGAAIVSAGALARDDARARRARRRHVRRLRSRRGARAARRAQPPDASVLDLARRSRSRTGGERCRLSAHARRRARSPTPAARAAARPAPAGIVGLGRALPERVVANAEIAARLGVERRVDRAPHGHPRAPLRRARAARQRARRARRRGARRRRPRARARSTWCSWRRSPPTRSRPAPRRIVAHELGIESAAAIDVGAACAGSLAALAHATAWIEAGRARNVLVIGAEVAHALRRLRRSPHRAAVRRRRRRARRLARRRRGRSGRSCSAATAPPRGAIRATRDEAASSRWKATRPSCGRREALRRARARSSSGRRLTLEDVDLFVYHQANSRILAAVAERLELPRGRVFDCIAELGNTSAASVPLALGEAVRDGRLARARASCSAPSAPGSCGARRSLTWGAW